MLDEAEVDEAEVDEVEADEGSDKLLSSILYATYGQVPNHSIGGNCAHE